MFCLGGWQVPGFLATSFSRTVAEEFRDTHAYVPPGGSRILWTVHVDPAGEHDETRRCQHVNFVSHSHIKNPDGTPREAEFLFTVRPWAAGTLCGNRALSLIIHTTLASVPGVGTQRDGQNQIDTRTQMCREADSFHGGEGGPKEPRKEG